MDMKHQCEELKGRLDELDWVTAPIHIKRLSKDFFWFSPILNEQLTGKKADIAVKPRTHLEIEALVRECVNLDMPLTVRGGGTANYGQSVPLHGGVIMDTTNFNQIKWLKDGVVCVEPGIKIGELETAVREHGYELRCMPSTYKTATIGGMFSGGFGGIGSINYGPLAAPGTVLGIKLMTIESEPKTLTFRGEDALTYNHTYGTNGIITEMEIALAPAREWNEWMFTFNSLESAYQFAHKLAYSTGIEKRNVALFDSKNANYFPHGEKLATGDYLVIALCTSAAEEPLNALLKSCGGHVHWYQNAEQASATDETLMECCWNHSTLQALKYDKSLTHLQTGYDAHRVVEQLQEMLQLAPAEVGIHLEFIKTSDGEPMITGLPLIQYQSAERLKELMAIHESVGIHINDSHVFTLEDGKHGGSLNQNIINSMFENDPHHLLNLGKVRTRVKKEAI